MTREDIIEMAREAGMVVHDQDQPYMEMLERFAQLVKQHVQIEQMPKFEELALLVREDERKACAKVCKDADAEIADAEILAERILARGNG
jgi:hypothetical protein